MSEKKRVTCTDVAKHICENLNEGLNSEKCRAIKKHLEDCPNCMKYFESVEKTIRFYKKYDVNLSKDAHQRLMNMLGLND
jgi:predicted anti-sigma-YlaC factor YlaD